MGTLLEFGYGHHHGGRAFGFLFFVLVVLALVAVAVWLFTLVSGRGRSSFSAAAPAQSAPGGADPALAALRLRYARGEVTRDEFLRTSADLGAPAAEPPPG